MAALVPGLPGLYFSVMNVVGRHCFFLLLFLFLAGAVVAENAPKAEPTKKAFTNEDLDARRPPRPRPMPEAEATAEGSGPLVIDFGPRSLSEEEIAIAEKSSAQGVSAEAAQSAAEGDSNAYWRERARILYDKLKAAQENVQDVATALEAAKSPFRPGADPYNWYKANPEVERLTKDLEAAQEKVTAIETEIAELEREAGDAGIPPGYVSGP
jgi:hypothetical protein